MNKIALSDEGKVLNDRRTAIKNIDYNVGAAGQKLQLVRDAAAFLNH